MKKIKVQQEFDCALDVLLRAREERYKHLDKFPELKNVHIVSEERVDHILKQKRNISIADSMPPIIGSLLPSGADTLAEESEFDDRSNTHTFRVVPGGNLDNIFVVKGVSHYYSLPENRSARDYDIEITSRAFLVSLVVENAIADLYEHNLRKDRKSILNFIQILEEEGGGESGTTAG